MRRHLLIVSSLIYVAAISGCASNGLDVKPSVCPKLPSPPASLMQPSKAAEKVQAELFEQPKSATPKSQDSKR